MEIGVCVFPVLYLTNFFLCCVVLGQRDHWMSHASNALSEVSSLRGQLSTTAKELDREQIARDNLLKVSQIPLLNKS